MAYFNIQYQHIPLKTEYRLRQDNHCLGWESTLGSLDYEVNCYKPPLFVMDFVHHLPLPHTHTHTHTHIPTYLLKNSIHSQNVVFSFEHEALEKIQKPNNPICNTQHQNTLELNSIDFHFKVPTGICCLTILQ